MKRKQAIPWIVTLFIFALSGCDKDLPEQPCIGCDDLDFGAIDYEASWSPDGQWIAFEVGHQIWKRKVNGDSLTQLTHKGRNYFPTWSPDGKKLAFDSNSQSAFYEIMTMDSDGGNQVLVGYDPKVGDCRTPSKFRKVKKDRYRWIRPL